MELRICHAQNRRSFWIRHGYIDGPVGFNPKDTNISGSLIIAGTDLSHLGVDATEIANGGSLKGGVGTVNWSATVVPEPSTYEVLMGAMGLAITFGRRYRRGWIQPRA